MVDRLIAFLMRPRVRRVRRWSFLVTLPAAALVAALVDVGSGIAVIAARAVLTLLVVVLAWRLPGERGEALKDLLLHPRLRRYLRAERDVLLVLPRLLVGLVRARPPAALRYQRGSFRGVIVLGLLPGLAGEAALIHAVVPSSWIFVHVVAAGLHVYALAWVMGWAFGARAYPHRLAAGALVVRGGPFVRARVPVAAVAAARPLRRRVSQEALVEEGADGEVLVPSRGRVDLLLDLREPVLVQRPIGEPLRAQRLLVATDDPGGLVDLLASAAERVAQAGTAARQRSPAGLHGLLPAGAAIREGLVEGAAAG